ncbi:MAG: glycosyltransferase family 4 protein [Acidothermus cellulolyticus]|nr:glycosyltransferase family 4 protein [Acidothermus cellulolyticus]
MADSPVLIAAATRNPLHPGTFSGLSARLFAALADEGFDIVPVTTRILRPHDLLTGAVNIRGFLKGRFHGRDAPRVNPAWMWSRRGYQRFCRRFDAALAGMASAPVVQVGTHVRPADRRFRHFCITDATVVQALQAGEFSVSAAGSRIADEAVAWQREIFESCERIFTLSHWAAQSVVADYGIPADRVVVSGAGANVDEPLPRQVDTVHPYVLFVGADWAQKGGPLLLEAFRRVRSRFPAARLVIVGCRPRIAEPGVEVVGPLRRSVPAEKQRLFELYARASCFCILSRFEAFGIVFLEAGFFGVPVVTLDGGARPEIIVDNTTGFLVPQRNPDDIADRILAILTDPDRAERMGHAARQRVCDHFTWPVVAAKIAPYLRAGRNG